MSVPENGELPRLRSQRVVESLSDQDVGLAFDSFRTDVDPANVVMLELFAQSVYRGDVQGTRLSPLRNNGGVEELFTAPLLSIGDGQIIYLGLRHRPGIQGQASVSLVVGNEDIPAGRRSRHEIAVHGQVGGGRSVIIGQPEGVHGSPREFAVSNVILKFAEVLHNRLGH